MKPLEYSESDISKIARKLTPNLQAGDILALEGDLAAGKTTLTRALLRELGYNRTVNSPTFVLEHRYPINHNYIKEVIHLDLYRLETEQLKAFDWQEYFSSPDRLLIIEWPERADELLPARTKRIKLEIIDAKVRRLTFSENFSDRHRQPRTNHRRRDN